MQGWAPRYTAYDSRVLDHVGQILSTEWNYLSTENRFQSILTRWTTDALPWKQFRREVWLLPPSSFLLGNWTSPCFSPAFSDSLTSYLPPQDALLLREW